MRAMNLALDRETVDLQRCGILRLRDAASVVIECRRGCLWITQEGDERDIVLHAGERMRLTHDGLTLVEALESATLALDGYWAELGIHHPPRFAGDLAAR